MIDSLLLTAVRISTYLDNRLLTVASGFFFERDDRIYLVTSLHVMADGPSNHYPDHLQLELHSDPGNLSASVAFHVPLYRDGKSLWIAGTDDGGDIDVAAIELEREALPATLHYCAFTPLHIASENTMISIGSPLLLVGFPLGFHDALHHMPVARHAVSASAFGLRFQGKGFFLTDARMHRGSSGSPVVLRVPGPQGPELSWLLLGIHSAKIDMSTRDLELDEALGLNCAWYADILMAITDRTRSLPANRNNMAL